jgi:hypothetical protein
MFIKHVRNCLFGRNLKELLTKEEYMNDFITTGF